MIASKITKENITETDLHNLNILKSLLSFDGSFKLHAKAINDLFYWHVSANSIDNEIVYLDSDSIYALHQLVSRLPDFKH